MKRAVEPTTDDSDEPLMISIGLPVREERRFEERK